MPNQETVDRLINLFRDEPDMGLVVMRKLAIDAGDDDTKAAIDAVLKERYSPAPARPAPEA